jgi:hypothetical protein
VGESLLHHCLATSNNNNNKPNLVETNNRSEQSKQVAKTSEANNRSK